MDDRTIEALREALDDEYKARATYRKVIEAFGPVRPFVNIVEAEDRHAGALLALLARVGVAPPRDAWPERVVAPRTLADACRAAVEAEIGNEAMYQRLLRQVGDPAARRVMRRLQQASQERHLPAFRRCLEREAGRSDRASDDRSGGEPAGRACGGPRRARRRRRGA